MEKTKENTQKQADIIYMISVPIQMLDVEYCKELVKDMIAQADRQETLAILNPSHLSVKNAILRTQAMALKSLCEYVDSLKKVDALKKELLVTEKERLEIEKLFI